MRKLIDLPNTQQNAFEQHPKAKTKSQKHESAPRQVAGQAKFIDDIITPANTLHVGLGLANVAAGKITALDLSKVKASSDVIDVITVDDVPGHNDIGPVFSGDPLLADGEIKFHGQVVFAVLAKSQHAARVAAGKAILEVDETPALLTVDDAKQANSKVRPSHAFGDETRAQKAIEAIQQSEVQVSGSLKIGGQEHIYLEGQIALAIPEEDGRMLVYCSSQHPSEVQKLIAEVLDEKLNKITVDMRRMGGGFGGKETQAAPWACLAALFASRNNCAVKCRVPRQQDLMVTGKRHPFENTFNVGTDANGKITAAQIEVNGNCGHSPDLSDAIVDRAMFHADNCYFLPQSAISGHRLKTNTVSHTAFRGFGGPQGMIMAEAMLDKIARATEQDPLAVRKLNLYGETNGSVTPYGMDIEHHLALEMIEKLEADSDYWQRREQIKTFNQQSPIIKKGLALTPVKFGISFTAKHLNQAGALVHIYTDGSIQVNHGGTEMGQGLHTKIAQIAAYEFGLDIDDIEVTATRTDKVPNTSPTAASSGTDLNGKAVQNACITLKQRLSEFYAEHLATSGAIDSKSTEKAALDANFSDGRVHIGENSIEFAELIQQAYFGRVSLSSTGFYKTPKIFYDRESGQGRPFFYFSYGVSASEVSIDTLTGEYKVDRVDILHDVGASLNPAIDRGQIEGAFIQGMGWLTSEELLWDDKGRLISNNMATYKIPAIGDTPRIFNVELFDRANDEDSIYHSKAVGEPPFMLAISVWCALKDAISSISGYRQDPQLDTPATPEKVLKAVMAMQSIQEAEDASK